VLASWYLKMRKKWHSDFFKVQEILAEILILHNPLLRESFQNLGKKLRDVMLSQF
ncbi:17176_t:CDS:2, partial [Acaulospora morrowiae]